MRSNGKVYVIPKQSISKKKKDTKRITTTANILRVKHFAFAVYIDLIFHITLC